MVAHQCKTCPTILVYDQKTRPKIYCAPCKRAADKKSNSITQRMRRERFGRKDRGTYWKEEEQNAVR